MYDIEDSIANAQLQDNDPQGYIGALDRWSPRLASRLADEEGIVLTDEHWQIIFCLRESYRLLGPAWTAREMTHRLQGEYAEVGGLHYLYELFPHGPLAQACRLAGLPLPLGTLSSSFGSVH